MDYVLKLDKKAEKIARKFDLKVQEVSVIEAKNSRDFYKKVDQAKGLVVVQGGDDEINRLAVSSKKVDILLSPEKGRVKDFMHQRNSGLNHVLCKLAKSNNVKIGFSFSSLLNSKDKVKLLGRMMQNARLIRKYKVGFVFGSFASSWDELRREDDLEALSRVVGLV